MAEVPGSPYEPFFTAQPTERPIQLRGVDAPGAAFGENIASAVQTFGGDVQQASGEVFNRALALRKLQIDGTIRDLTTQYYNEVAPIQSDFLAAKGAGASQDALNAHLAQLEQVRQKYQQQANQYGPYGVNRFGEEAASLQRSFIREGAVYSATQTKAAAADSSEASSRLRWDMMTKNPDDERGFNDHLKGGVADKEAEMFARFGVHEDSPITKQAVFDYTSKAYAARANGWIGRGDPDTARKFIEDNKDKLTPEDYKQLTIAVGQRAHALYSTNIVDDFYKQHVKPDGTMDMSTTDAQQWVREEALKRYPDLRELPGDAARALDARLSTQRFAARNDSIDSRTQFYRFMGQYHPQSDEEFLQIKAANGLPSGADLARKLGQTDPQFSLQKKIFDFNRDANVITEKAAMLRVNGMWSNGQDGGVPAFLGIKDWGAYGIKNPNDIMKLQSKQFELSKTPKGDQRVEYAVNLARHNYGPQMDTLGIFQRSQKKPADFDSFVGMLQEAIQIYQQDNNGKFPDDKTLIETTIPQVLHTHAVSAWGGLTTRQQPVYHGYIKPMPEDVPRKFADDITDEAVKAGGSAPTPYEIYNAYLRNQYNKIMELEKKQSGGITATAPTSR